MPDNWTPGPWRIERHPFEISIECANPSESWTIALVNGRPHAPEIAANARLIAAAPDMLAALQALLERYLVMGCGEGIEARAAKLAIAKATVRSGTEDER